MGSPTHGVQVGQLEVVDTGRRRRWSEDENLRIVAESLRGPRLAPSTAPPRISTSLAFAWRRNGLALQVQEALRRDPHAGDLFVFREARGNLIKILWHDGLGMPRCANRLKKRPLDLDILGRWRGWHLGVTACLHARQDRLEEPGTPSDRSVWDSAPILVLP